MNNNQQQHSDGTHRHIELDQSKTIYLLNDIVSGNFLYLKREEMFVSSTGIVYFGKHKSKIVSPANVFF
jgi:hypothetical protein